jgi:hypothetical protein
MLRLIVGLSRLRTYLRSRYRTKRVQPPLYHALVLYRSSARARQLIPKSTVAYILYEDFLNSIALDVSHNQCYWLFLSRFFRRSRTYHL